MLQSYLDFPLITNQIELSAYNLENFKDGTLDLCQEERIAPMAWSPLAGGSIFSSDDERAKNLRDLLERIALEIGAKGIDEVLYAWLISHPANIMPIVGSGKMSRIESAICSLDLTLTRDQWFDILQAAMGREVA
jgi:predicted oxidoreductase